MVEIAAGKLRHRVQVQNATESRDAFGGVTQSWSTAATVWASISPMSGRERFQGDKVSADVSHIIRLRYRADLTITAKSRIVFGSRVFQIQSILNAGEANVYSELACIETVV